MRNKTPKSVYNKLSVISFGLTILGLFFLILTPYSDISNNLLIYLGSILLIMGFIVAIISLGGIRESFETSLKVNNIGLISTVIKSLIRLKDKDGAKGAGFAVVSICIFLIIIIILLISVTFS